MCIRDREITAGISVSARSVTTTGSPRVNARPDSESPTTTSTAVTSSAATPSAIITRSFSPPAEGRSTTATSAPDISRARLAISVSTSWESAPDSRLVVTSEDAWSHASRRRVSSYILAFSMATPAAVARAMTMASSSSSKSPPPRFSVR